MSTDTTSLMIFLIVTTFTPGPGNIASATMGMMHGYRRTFRFLTGIVSGYLMIMLLCALLSGKLIQMLPVIVPFLRIVGAGYITWLAISILRASHEPLSENRKVMDFKYGFLLQALNPKAMIFGITIYTSFLASYTSSTLPLVTSALALATVTFCSVSLWAIVGARIQTFFDQERVRQLVNFILFLMLLYCSISLSGLFW